MTIGITHLQNGLGKWINMVILERVSFILFGDKLPKSLYLLLQEVSLSKNVNPHE